MFLSRRLFSSLGFKQRTHTCGALTEKDHGQRVVLNGWLQRARRTGDDLVFVPLRDGYGTTQLVVQQQQQQQQASLASFEALKNKVLALSVETVVSVEGVVHKRPSDAIKV